MIEELRRYLARYIKVTEALAAALDESSLVREYPRGRMLLREGEPMLESYFLLKGCVRSYVLREGGEVTLDFFVEEEAVIPLGYGAASFSTHFLECLENTVALVARPEQEAEALSRYPELKSLCLTLSEIMVAKLQESQARYKSSTPEERYLDLVERRPDLLQRIPQYHIASYVGVQPESLSRIRKRIARP